jgi:hypothetical protein
LLGQSSSTWPLWTIVLLAFIAGCSVASWNGVQIAEVARLSPPELISETASGSSVLINISNMVIPTAFAVFVSMSGRYDYAFMAAGVCSLLVLPFLPRNEPRAA